MRQIEAYYSGGVKIPESWSFAVGDNAVYVDLGDGLPFDCESEEDVEVKTEVIGEAWEKKIIGITSDLEAKCQIIPVNGAAYFVNGFKSNYVCKVSEEGVVLKHIDDVIGDADIPHTWDSIDHLGYDGRFLYVQRDNFSNSLDPIMIKTNLNLKAEGYISKVLALPIHATGKSVFFANTGNFEWQKYEFGNEVLTLNFESQGHTTLVKSLTYKGDKEEWKGREAMIMHPFTDGTELYCPDTAGDIWHIGSEKAERVFSSDRMITEHAMDSADNGREGVLVFNGKILIFSGGKLTGSGDEIPSGTLLGVQMDDKSIYLKYEECIRRYAMIR